MSDGATLKPAVDVKPVYAKREGGPWVPFVVPRVCCEMVESGELPAWLFIAGLSLGDRN